MVITVSTVLKKIREPCSVGIRSIAEGVNGCARAEMAVEDDMFAVEKIPGLLRA